MGALPAAQPHSGCRILVEADALKQTTPLCLLKPLHLPVAPSALSIPLSTPCVYLSYTPAIEPCLRLFTYPSFVVVSGIVLFGLLEERCFCFLTF
jgi:hypothetical protein